MKLVPLFLIFIFSFSFAQETVESIKKQIHAVGEETKREKALHESEKKRHADFISAGKSKVIALNTQMKSIRAEIDSMKAEISRLNDARKKASSASKFYENKKGKYAEQLSESILSLTSALETDFPYKNEESVQSLKEISEQLKKGIISTDDALGRTLELFTERIRLGYTTEVWNGFLNADARQISGSFLRYGAVSCIFISNDNNEFFILEKKDKNYTWKNVSDDLNTRALLKEALKVAEGKTPPKLVLFPVSLPEDFE